MDVTGEQIEIESRTASIVARCPTGWTRFNRDDIDAILAALRDARAENLRTREDLDRMTRHRDVWQAMAEENSAMIDELRAEVARLTGVVQAVETLCAELTEEAGDEPHMGRRAVQRGIVQQLRAALIGGTDE